VAGAVDWALAERIGTRLAASGPPSPQLASLEAHLHDLTAEAEELVARETGLRSQAGPARAQVVDRAGWVRANLTSFQRLLTPFVARMEEQLSGRRATVPRAVSGVLSGTELGVLLGWMSGRVLGQYDLLVLEEEGDTAGDVVYYVGPNLLQLEHRFGFPPEEFRLWIALHEVTHRAQFTGVPWLREHFLSLLGQALQAADPDPARLAAAMKETARMMRAGERPLDDGGLLGLVATPEQRVVLRRIGGMMSVLEGHGERTMDRAGADRVPSAARFHDALRARRTQVSPVARLVQRLLGFEAKLAQYAQGERFLIAIEEAAGRPAVDLLWEGPDRLPSLEEVRDPDAWLARVGLAPAAV
jgi:coenzyme F420 biosynthesis associated uncharacterized protein